MCALRIACKGERREKEGEEEEEDTTQSNDLASRSSTRSFRAQCTVPELCRPEKAERGARAMH
eukprot:10101875-Karenia_brevis.AAC.1